MDDPVETQIEEAMARGEFKNLPGHGKPLSRDDAGPGWWARRKLAEMRRQDQIDEMRRSIDHRMGDLWPLRTEEEVLQRVAELNLEIEAFNAELNEEDRLDALDPAAMTAMWRRMWRARG